MAVVGCHYSFSGLIFFFPPYYAYYCWLPSRFCWVSGMFHDFFYVLNVITEVRVEQGWKFFCVLSPLGQKKCLACI